MQAGSFLSVRYNGVAVHWKPNLKGTACVGEAGVAPNQVVLAYQWIKLDKSAYPALPSTQGYFQTGQS